MCILTDSSNQINIVKELALEFQFYAVVVIHAVVVLIGYCFLCAWVRVVWELFVPAKTFSFLLGDSILSNAYSLFFRLCRGHILRALTATLAVQSLFISVVGWSRVVVGGLDLDVFLFAYADILPDYLMVYVGAIIICSVLGGQGLALRLSSGLSVTYDSDKSIAFHIADDKFKIEKKSVLDAVMEEILKGILQIRSLDVANAVVVRSWLFVSGKSRNNSESEAFRKAIALPAFLLFIYPNFDPAGGFEGGALNRGRVWVAMIPSFLYLCAQIHRIKKARNSVPCPAENGYAMEKAEKILKEAFASACVRSLLFEPISVMTAICIVIKMPSKAYKLGAWTRGFEII